MITNYTQRNTSKAMFIDDDHATNVYHSINAKEAELAQEVATHTNAVAALTELRNTPKEAFPAYLFVDINMPSMSGHEFMTELRKLEGYDPQQTCVVFVTSSLSMKDVVLADENKVDQYKWKPLAPADFAELRNCAKMN